MMRQTFLLDVTEQERYTHLMQVLGRIIPGIQSYKLSLPHDYNALPLVRKMILDKLA